MAEAAHDTPISSTPASVSLGARIEGLDLSQDIGAEVIGELRQLLLDHHLLVIPGQRLSALELAAFGRRWGDLLTHPATASFTGPKPLIAVGRRANATAASKLVASRCATIISMSASKRASNAVHGTTGPGR